MDENINISIDQDFLLWTILSEARDTLLKARSNELRGHGISSVEARALTVIHEIGNKTTPAEISRKMVRRQNTVAALLTRMKKKGLVLRERDRKRKNMWKVSLTEKGENAYRQSMRRVSLHEAMFAFSENEKQQLSSYLKEIRDAAVRQLPGESTFLFSKPSQSILS